MRNILKNMYYLIKNLILNINSHNITISYSAKIAGGTKLGKYTKIGSKSYIKGVVGNYTYISSYCRINADIGSFCSISPNVKIIEATHPVKFVSTSPVFYSTKKQCGISFVEQDSFEEILHVGLESELACKIGNDVWIGENALIKGGITIGNGAIIAMGAVVVSDVEPYSIFGGVPAKKIGTRFNSEEISVLEKTKWWDNSEQWLKENSDVFLNVRDFMNRFENR